MPNAIWGADFKGQKLTGLGPGVAVTDAVTLGQISDVLSTLRSAFFVPAQGTSIDNRAAINAAIAQANATPGSTVILGAGSHRLTGPLDPLVSGTLGPNPGAKITLSSAYAQGTSGGIITLSGKNAAVKTLMIQGGTNVTTSSSNQPVGAAILLGSGALAANVEDIDFTAVNGYCLLAETLTAGSLYGGVFTGLRGNYNAKGIRIAGDVGTASYGGQVFMDQLNLQAVQNGTVVDIESINDVQIGKMNCSVSGNVAAAYGLRVAGVASTIIVDSYNAGSSPTVPGVAAGIIIGDGGTPNNVQINGGVSQSTAVAVLVTGGFNIRLWGLQYSRSAGPGVRVTGGDQIDILDGIFARNGKTAAANNVEIDIVSTTARVRISRNRFTTPVGTATEQVANVLRVPAVNKVMWDTDNRIDGGHTTAQVITGGRPSITDAIRYGSFFPEEYGAVGDGTTDDTAAFAAAGAAMVAAGGGVLLIGAKTYKVTSLPNFAPVGGQGPLTYSVVGRGSSLSKILLVGTSATAGFVVSNPTFNPGNGVASTGSPTWQGFTLDGTGSSGGCSGIVWGDVSYPTFIDIECNNFATGDGWMFSNQYGWTEGIHTFNCKSQYNAVQLHFDVGSGRQLGTLSTVRTAGTAYTTIVLSAGVTDALYVGQKLVVAAAPSAPGVYTTTVTVATAAAVGATTITVQSFTPTTTLPAGTARLHIGGYGSFDYCNFDGFYMQGNANQHGIVSESSRGIDQRVDRLGTHMRITGNFRAGTTNTGIVFWLKGPSDTWNDTSWDFAVETGGTGVTHKSIQLDTNTSTFGGGGDRVAFYGCETATLNLYQFNLSCPKVCIKGVSRPATDPNAATTYVSMRNPGKSNVGGGVRPSGYTIPAFTGTAPARSTGAWQNTTGFDILVTVPVIFTGAGNLFLNIDVWNGLPVGTVVQVAAAATGYTHSLTFIHHADMWAIISTSTANINLGAPLTSYL